MAKTVKDTYTHRIRNHTLQGYWESLQMAVDFLGTRWPGGLMPISAKSFKTIGIGNKLDFFSGEQDDEGDDFLLASIPGDASALKKMENSELTAILSTIYEAWFDQKKHRRTKLYILADHFDDRMENRLLLLKKVIPVLDLLPLRNFTQMLDPAQKSPAAGPETTFTESVRAGLLAGKLLDEYSVVPIETQMQAGWARQRVEKIDLLGVDARGRLIVLEFKAVGDARASSLRASIFQALNYLTWVANYRRALQIIYGGSHRIDIRPHPALFVLNAGAAFSDEILSFERTQGATEGLDPLIRFFSSASVEEFPKLLTSSAQR